MELRNTTIISMVRLAMIVLMAFLDLRFRLILLFAHFTILIFLSHSATAFGFFGRFSKTGKFKRGISTRSQFSSPCYGEDELVVARSHDGDSVRIARAE